MKTPEVNPNPMYRRILVYFAYGLLILPLTVIYFLNVLLLPITPNISFVELEHLK